MPKESHLMSNARKTTQKNGALKTNSNISKTHSLTETVAKMISGFYGCSKTVIDFRETQWAIIKDWGILTRRDLEWNYEVKNFTKTKRGLWRTGASKSVNTQQCLSIIVL